MVMTVKFASKKPSPIRFHLIEALIVYGNTKRSNWWDIHLSPQFSSYIDEDTLNNTRLAIQWHHVVSSILSTWVCSCVNTFDCRKLSGTQDESSIFMNSCEILWTYIFGSCVWRLIVVMMIDTSRDMPLDYYFPAWLWFDVKLVKI